MWQKLVLEILKLAGPYILEKIKKEWEERRKKK